MRKTYLIILLVVAIYGCKQRPTQHEGISVSIEPLRYLTEQITGNDFEVSVLVPPGSSPETYEPTPTQMKQVANSLAYVDIGLIDFEKNLEKAIRENMPDVEVIRTSDGIALLEGEHDHGAAGSHGHGTDPHIWTSPRRLKAMAGQIYERIAARFPDSAKYADNYRHFLGRMDSLDSRLKTLFAGQPTAFMIFHPALSYLADDYGLTQIALENEGKEPSAEHLRSLIETARENGIDKILYQRQFSRNTVDALARELGIEAVPIDPLAYDIPGSLLSTAQLIVRP